MNSRRIDFEKVKAKIEVIIFEVIIIIIVDINKNDVCIYLFLRI